MSTLSTHPIQQDFLEKETIFADVILPIPIPKLFTYRVPFELNECIKIGSRVIVQFGKRKILTGIVGNLHHSAPEKYTAKYILEVLDESPIVSQSQLRLFFWMAEYYMCTIGEVINIAIPSGLKLSSESKIQLNPHFNPEETALEFSDREYIILAALKNQDTLSYQEISDLLGIKNIYVVLKSLVFKEAVLIIEELKERYKPKVEKRIRLTQPLAVGSSALEPLFEQLQNKPKQEAILLKYLQEVPIFQKPELNPLGIKKNVFRETGLSGSSLKTLIKHGVLEEFERVISRFPEIPVSGAAIKLTEAQLKVKEEVLTIFEQKNVALLHGITGSGKTEIYINLIREVLAGGHQVLYLLPEIALTTQIVGRLQKVFGDKMGVYHSRFSDNERVEVWRGVLSGKFPFVVGVRSSVFLPFDNLGLIIIDEEHEPSYKQFEPAPRYHARDTALVLAQLQHAKVLLGSATPSIESYYNADTGKYGLVKLQARYGSAQLPGFQISDMVKERQKKTIKGEFSGQLLEALNKALENQQQAIIFQNRRGYSPQIVCQDCDWVPKCTNCAVSLTYHQYKQELSCHYCGYREPLPVTCDLCGSHRLKTVGIGTEQLEESLSLLLPQARIQRMDLDTTRSKYSYENIISNFEDHHIDILVGTQMVSKGLDFDHVSLVGIFDLDRMLHFPDFRSYERTFQLVTQVSGRAGRKAHPGKVVVQTKNTTLPILNKIIRHDYERFYAEEIKERNQHAYPPFVRLIKVTVKDKDQEICEKTARHYASLLRARLSGRRVLGPEPPLINKIRNEYLMEMLVKLERAKVDLKSVKGIMTKEALLLTHDKPFKSAKIVFDVDPY